MNDAEGYIKSKLDGTFTWVCRISGAVKTRAVEPDFIPDHAPPEMPIFKGGKAPPRTKRPRCLWTPDNDAELMRLRRQGWSKLRCAHAFNTTEDAIRQRIKRLRDLKVEAY